MRRHPIVRVNLLRAALGFALVLAGCASVGGNLNQGDDSADLTAAASDAEKAGAANSRGERPTDDELRAVLGDLDQSDDFGCNASCVLALLDSVIREGGSLGTGPITVEKAGSPPVFTIRVDRVLIGGGALLGSAYEVRGTHPCCDGSVSTGDVDFGSDALIAVTEEGHAALVALPSSGGKTRYVEASGFGLYALGLLLNSKALSALTHTVCAGGSSGAISSSREDTEPADVLVAYLASQPARDEYASAAALEDEAVRIADDQPLKVDEATGKTVPVDHFSIHRQLLAGVSVDELEFTYTVPVTLRFESDLVGRDLLIADETNVLGIVRASDQPVTAFMAPSRSGSIVDVYLASSEPSCDLAPGARVASAEASGNPLATLSASAFNEDRLIDLTGTGSP